MTTRRATADELTAALKSAIDRYVAARCWRDRAEVEERLSKYAMDEAICAIEQRMLEAPKPNEEGVT